MTAYQRCVEKMRNRGGVAAKTNGAKSAGLSHDARILIAHHAADSAAEYGRMPGPETVQKLARSAVKHVGLSGADRKAGAALFVKNFSESMGRLAGRKINPAEKAAAKYEEFHGRPAESEVVIETDVHEHDFVAGLGRLESLTVVTVDGDEVDLSGFRGALLSMAEDGSQLFIDGGDQSVDLAEFGFDEPYKELMILGEVLTVGYYTTKDHLGADGGTAVYVHTFGEDGGRLPSLLYSTKDKLLQFAGGDYTIPAEGITN